jgi:hypothetical protein
LNPTLADYPRVASRVAPRHEGIAAVIHQEITANEAFMVAARMQLPVDDGPSVALQISGECFMSDIAYERSTCLELAHNARGRVLIAGLGLGMVLPPLLDDAQVDRITVIEKVGDVIALIGPHYTHPKLRVMHGDIFKWRPAAGETFDTIYFDIWPLIHAMNLVQMTYLHRAFAPFLAQGGWIESWMRRHLLQRARTASRRVPDPYAGEMGPCGNANAEEDSPAAARSLLGILRRLQKVPLGHALFVATSKGTMESTGLHVLPNEGVGA